MAKKPLAAATKAAGGVTHKQAVVVIHGIGEQIPLQTLRSFVETVYERDEALALRMTAMRTVATPTVKQPVKQTWIVPDQATGTAELRRISTPPDANGLRTDFFEFYWADIMNGTPVDEVVGWIRGLLLRSPFALPRDVRVITGWLALWAIALFLTVFTLSTLDPTGSVFEWLVGPVRDALVANRGAVGWVLAFAGVFAGVTRLLGIKPFPRVKLLLPMGLLLGGLVLVSVPQAVIVNDKIWSAAIAAVIAAVLNGIVGPYVGDIVRYVRAAPKTVEKRKQVRERGLALLKALHHRDPTTKIADYERIIVVGHSLGSIIGYDLIQLYWEQAGPTHHQPPMTDPLAHEAMSAVDVFVKKKWVAGEPDEAFDIREYQRRQGLLFDQISAAGLDFRISDFITLGSPLTHADFLLADDEQQLQENFDLRLLSSSPPRPNRPWKTMIYGENAWARTKSKNRFIHFAAPFAAVRWTNIYDYSPFAPFGDLLSGTLIPKFGAGIRELPVEIMRPGWLPIFRRLATHTLYWGWDARFDGNTPAHILALRGALNLRGAARGGTGKETKIPMAPDTAWEDEAPETHAQQVDGPPTSASR
jgi:hypothetical protein